MYNDENNLNNYTYRKDGNEGVPQHPSVDEQLRNYQARQGANPTAANPTPVSSPVPADSAAPVNNSIPVDNATPVNNPIPADSAMPVDNSIPVDSAMPVTQQGEVDDPTARVFDTAAVNQAFHAAESAVNRSMEDASAEGQTGEQPQADNAANEQSNVYHTTTVPHSTYATTPPQPVQSTQTQSNKAEKKNHLGLKVAAIALSCALVGGAAGAGIVSAISHNSNRDSGTSINVSGRTASQVTLKSVDGKTELSDAENYAANVNSVVSINCSAATTNYFGQTVESASSGSGFIITADGYIATNYHVINGASSVQVTLFNGDTYDAKVIGGDSDYDIAVLKIDATGLQAVTLGNSDTLNVGDHVLAIGNPLGELTFSMSGGMVSCVNRPINIDGTPFNMIQTDTSINPGNSGGPLVNSYGEVIGIVSAKYASTSSYSAEAAEGLGFAIPINDVAATIQDIMTNGYVTNKPYLGITAGTINSSMAQQTNLPEGVYIYSVASGSAAEKAGLQVGDVITKIDNTTLTSLEDLTAIKKGYSTGDTSTFTISRDGKTQTVELTWGAQPSTSDTDTDTSTNATQGQNGNSGDNGQGNQDMQDLFDYFFGQYGNGNSGNGGTYGNGTYGNGAYGNGAYGNGAYGDNAA